MSGSSGGALFGDGSVVEGFDGKVSDAAEAARDAIRRGAYSRISCLSCGTVIGAAVGGGAGGAGAGAGATVAAYCGDCWRMHMEDAREAGSDGDKGGAGDEAGTGGSGNGNDNAGGDVDVGGDGDGAGVQAPADPPQSGEELAHRLRRVMHSLETDDVVNGKAPRRTHVIGGMLMDGGGGVWKTAEDAARCLDGVLSGIVYEPSDGRLALIDGE